MRVWCADNGIIKFAEKQIGLKLNATNGRPNKRQGLGGRDKWNCSVCIGKMVEMNMSLGNHVEKVSFLLLHQGVLMTT